MDNRFIGDTLYIILVLACLGSIGYLLFRPGQTPEMTEQSHRLGYLCGGMFLLAVVIIYLVNR